MGATIGPPTRRARAMIRTGTYTGDGNDDRNIDIGIDLAAKNNVFVLTKANANQYPYGRIEYGQGDLTMVFFNTADNPNNIQAFTATGFQIGSDVSVNNNAILYRYIVWWEEP